MIPIPPIANPPAATFMGAMGVMGTMKQKPDRKQTASMHEAGNAEALKNIKRSLSRAEGTLLK